MIGSEGIWIVAWTELRKILVHSIHLAPAYVTGIMLMRGFPMMPDVTMYDSRSVIMSGAFAVCARMDPRMKSM
jgi:hypothetical protein